MGEVKFREGDIVNFPDGIEKDEYRIDEIDGGLAVITWLSPKHGPTRQAGSHYLAEAALLRRPMRVGDCVRHMDGTTFVVTERALVDAWGEPALWTHEDGTPIDPPTPVATKQPESRAVFGGPGKEPIGWTVGAGGGGGSAGANASLGAHAIAKAVQERLSDWTSRGFIATTTPEDLEAHFGVATDDPKPADTGFVKFSASGEWKQVASVMLRFVKKSDGAPCEGETLLARTIFKTDPAVIAIVTEKSDCTRRVDHGVREHLQLCGRPMRFHISAELGMDRKAYDRAMEIAWTRDEGGLATAAKKRAAEIVAELRK